MISQAPVSPQQAARELAKLNPDFVISVLKFLTERYATLPLIGDTTDETLRKVYSRDGKLEAVKDFQELFFPKNTMSIYDNES